MGFLHSRAEKIVADAVSEQLKISLQAGKDVDEKYARLFEEKGITVVKYTNEELIARNAELRKTVWPKYEDLYGKEFLEKLEAYVVGFQQGSAGK